MKKVVLIAMAFTAVFSGCSNAKQNPLNSDQMQPYRIKSIMGKVADWQLDNPSNHGITDWTSGALFAGMTAWAQMADSDKYYDALYEFGERAGWQPGKREYHADDHAVGQMYIEMYKKYKEPKMIKGMQERFDWILANQPATALTHDSNDNKKRYNWCDALFMAPPVWTKLGRITGDAKYVDYMNKEWWFTTDYLYDTEEHLYFRDDRYFDKLEANGKKVFWSRGNGWVFGGVVRVLEELPEDHPDRSRYEKLYLEMAAKIKAIQPEEGLWHSSLLDPVSYPSVEASGSGFYCYGLAWGINHGYLNEDEYLPAVVKAWSGLVNCVHPDGMLGYVQPIGADPKQVTADQTEIYGVGSFLLAGSEVYKIAVRKGKEVVSVTVNNPGMFFRENATIEVEGFKDKSVFDLQSNKFVLSQTFEGKVLFQTDLAPGEKKCFWLMPQSANPEKSESQVRTYCRFVPERRDDFAWENDKTAYRMYGPSLEDETITCGIDAWAKCVPVPVIDEFYKNGTYHENHGKGGDFYKVGNTLGCGGAAPFVDGKICLPDHNFKDWKIIANGPIRSVFELSYGSWKAGSYNITEKKRISIDLGSNLNKVECFYSSDDTVKLTIAAGIVTGAGKSEQYENKDHGVIAYWLPADGKNGFIGCGVILPSQGDIIKADKHLLLVEEHTLAEPFVYYSGSCWNENDEFSTFDKWQRYLEDFDECLKVPVTVETEKIK